MSLFARLFLGYVLVVGGSVALLAWTSVDEIKPAMRQSAEETLVDTANLLAELVGTELTAEALARGPLADALAAYAQRRFDAGIWGHTKREPDYRVYVTDAAGIVVFDSTGRALGADYSQWRDVWLTLRGRYGARTTPADPARPEETIMYVAAPVRAGADIIGVLTVGKPNLGVQPLIDRAQRKLLAGAVAVVPTRVPSTGSPSPFGSLKSRIVIPPTGRSPPLKVLSLSSSS